MKRFFKWLGIIFGTIIVLFVVFLAAIGVFDRPDSKTKHVETEAVPVEKSPVQTAVDELLEHYKTAELSAKTEEILNRTLKLPEADMQAMNAVADGIQINYAYEDLYDVQTAYQKYLELPVYEGKIYPILENNQVSSDELYKRVVENNADFFVDKGYELVYELEDEHIRWACDIICKTINEALKNPDYNISVADVSEILWKLCIVKDGAGTTNAYIDDKGKMVLMPTNMETMNGIAMDDNAGNEIISHETFHIMQRASSDHAKTLQMDNVYGFSYEFPEGTLNVNSLDNTWIVEGMAELLASEFWNMEPITYKTKISYLKTLDYVHALGGYYKADSMKALSLQNSIEKVFETFGCETEEEQMELLKVLYTCNIIQEEPEDFMAAFTEKLGHAYSEEEITAMKLELKNSVCQYFSRVFYRNLAEQLTVNESSVEDIFELISTYESDLNVHLVYTDETRRSAYTEIFDCYMKLQDCLFESMAGQLGITPDEVQKAYNEFNGKMEIQTKTTLFIADSPEFTFDVIEIPWLDKETEELVNSKHVETSCKKTISIREYLGL